MHIEPGLVDTTKIALSFVTGTAALAWAVKLALQQAWRNGLAPVALRSVLAAALVYCFFEVLPHQQVGISEVHLILGANLMLLFGVGPAAIGLASGLLTQGLLAAPADLPQYGMNVTTLLMPLFATAAVARRVVPQAVAYVDISYAQCFRLSLAYQAGVVAWVAFWVIYGRGLGGENLVEIASFGFAYLAVLTIEPLVALGTLAVAKRMHGRTRSMWFDLRLHNVA